MASVRVGESAVLGSVAVWAQASGRGQVRASVASEEGLERRSYARRTQPGRSSPLPGPIDDVGAAAGWASAKAAGVVVGDSVRALGGALAWLVNTSTSAAIGLAVGAVMFAVVSQVRRRDAAR